MPGPPRNASRKTAVGAGPGAGQTRQIWLLQDGVPQPVSVKVGISDGRMTEVSAEGLEPGAQVITDQRMGKAAPRPLRRLNQGARPPRRPSSSCAA